MLSIAGIMAQQSPGHPATSNESSGLRSAMNESITKLISEVDSRFMCLHIDFKDSSWRDSIPSEPGWYLIKTNTPAIVLESVSPPKHEAHIDIPGTIRMVHTLLSLGIAISQTSGNEYVVYNGEAKNLKARAREHECGHAKTYCLAISEYESLLKYHWTFCHVAVSTCRNIRGDDKLIRIAVEQAWRTVHGWPILCRK